MTQPTAPAPLTGADLPLRPVVKAGLRRTWRDTTALQLGLGVAHGVVIEDAGPEVAAFLRRLDGTLERDALPIAAAEVGLDGELALSLVRRLADHGALDDAAEDSATTRRLTVPERERLAPDTASWALRVPHSRGRTTTALRRRAARVDVHGAGRIGALAAALLAHAGIGELHVVDPAASRPADLPAAWAPPPAPSGSATTTRADVALGVCEQLAPSLRTRRRRPADEAPAERPHVSLLAPVDTAGTIDLELRDSLMRTAAPHLTAYVRETVGVIGPFVLPGRSPCLRCLDLARTERDPAWPRLLAQLTPPSVASRRAVPDACDGVLAAAVAAQAVLQVLAYVDGHAPSAVGTTIETDLVDGLTRTRSWSTHPACGCGW